MLEQPLYTADEVAEKLRVSAAVVRLWLKDGKLRGVRLGDKAGWRVPEAELVRFLEERMR